MTDTEMTTEQWLAIRKAEALLIDPATAEVTWDWVRIMDPYGVRDLPSEMQCVGRVYFARRAWQHDLGKLLRSARRNPRCTLGQAADR